MNVFHWIAGWVLGLVWLSRVIDAGLGVRKIPDISLPEWDHEPTVPHPSVAIIVPARNEEESIEQAMLRLERIDGTSRSAPSAMGCTARVATDLIWLAWV